MKPSELKLRIISGLNRLVDDYYGENNFKDKVINATIKLIIKQNQNKYDYILDMFTDENGCIDSNSIISTYADLIGENGITVDIRQYINNDYLKSVLPNKVLIVNKSDIINLLT